MNLVHPLLLTPIYRDYIWGGTRIPQQFGRALPPGRYAESWEIADRPEGQSLVASGPFAGRSLHSLMSEFGPSLAGRGRGSLPFPLLIKLIDARETLSVQVHPNNENAHCTGGEPKTEMWYVLDAEPDACVYAGLKPGVTPDALRAAIADASVEELLIKVPVRAHDAVFMPGGRVHAIGAGCLLLECQQNSNTTYRLYDWGRVDAEGRARDLHVEPALQVINWNEPRTELLRSRRLEARDGNERDEIVSCPFFRMERLALKSAYTLPASPASFRALFVAEGAVEMEQPGYAQRADHGQTILVPAAAADLVLKPASDSALIMAMDTP